MFNKTNLFIIAAALAGLAVQSAEAIIVRAEVWRKKREDGTYQYVLAASDGHHTNLLGNPAVQDKLNLPLLEENMNMQCETLANLVSNSKSQLKVIVEDSSTHIDGTWAIPFAEEVAKGELLHKFAYECRAKQIDVANVEVRQKRIGAFGFTTVYPMYNDVVARVKKLKELCENAGSLSQCSEQQIADWKSESARLMGVNEQFERWNVKVSDLTNGFEDAVAEIKTYTDGEELSSYYAQELNRVGILQPSNKISQQMKLSQSSTFAEFLQSTKKNRAFKRLINYLLMSGVVLLDMKALHLIHQAFVNDKKDVLVVMGGAHIHNICTILQQLGYEKVEEVGCDRVIDHVGLNVTDADPLVTESVFNKATPSYQKILAMLQEQPLVDLDFFANYLPTTVSNECDGGLLRQKRAGDETRFDCAIQ